MRHYIRSFVQLQSLDLQAVYINSTFLPISKVLHPLYSIALINYLIKNKVLTPPII